MIRRLGRFLKPLLWALLVLVVSPCVLEVWLRWQEFRVGCPILSGEPRDELLAPSWQTHHQLKPLRRVVAKNPDTGEEFETRTNSFGLRGSEPVLPKPEGSIRVLVLGDETILGLEVRDDETFAARLQEHLKVAWQRSVEVINAAVPGDCPLIAALRLKHELAALQPDLVICHFDMTDVADDYSLRRHALLGHGDEPLACPNPLLEKPARGVGQTIGDQFLLARFAHQKVSGLWRQSRPEEISEEIDHPLGKFAWLADDPPDWTLHIRQAFASLDDVAKRASNGGSRMLVITCPTPWQVSSRASSGIGVRESAGVPEGTVFRSQLPFTQLGEFAKRHGLVVCDASPTFRADTQPEELFLSNAARLSATGHDAYAKIVAKFLAENSHSIPAPAAASNGLQPNEARF